MRTINTLINEVAEILTLSNYKPNKLTTTHEIAKCLVYDNICTLDLEDLNKNYDRILKNIKSAINGYINRN